MSLCGNVDAAGIRMPLHRFAGTIRRNKHRDDRAHGRLQNPLAQNDVRAGEPSRRWEARWNKWKGQPFANAILHDRLLAREAMFVTKTLEDPLRRVPLLAVNRAILFQNAVDDIRERRQLRALRRLASPISRRFRMQQYLGNRLAVDPELARSFPSAQTLTMTRQSHSSIKIHSVHPPPSIRSILTKAIGHL